MNRRLTPADLHPSIFEAIHLAANSGVSTTTGASHPAYSRFLSVWIREYWKGFVAWALLFIPTIAVPIAMKEAVGKPWMPLILMSSLAVWVGVGAILYQRNKNMVIWDEVEAMLPMLEISEYQRLYLDCVRAVLLSRVLEESQKQSWLASLNASLDQAMQLDRIHQDMRMTIGGTTPRELELEIERLRAKVEGSKDEAGREIFRQSLEMALERSKRSDGYSGQAERVEAHLELTRQTFLRTRETLMGLDIGSRTATQVDLEPLRANLSKVQDEAHAIREAIDELSQIRA